MDYNNILNNKKKLKEIKNVTLGFLNKATDKITEVTTTAVDSITDTVKNIGNQQAKISIFGDVVAYVDKMLIDGTLADENFRLIIMEYKMEGVEGTSVEEILKEVTSGYETSLKEALTDFEYIEGVYALIAAHYKHESGVNFFRKGGCFSISIVKEEAKEEVKESTNDVADEVVLEKVEEEHVCNCVEECETCACKEGITMVVEENEKAKENKPEEV